jgi:hypothetical protein
MPKGFIWRHLRHIMVMRTSFPSESNTADLRRLRGSLASLPTLLPRASGLFNASVSFDELPLDELTPDESAPFLAVSFLAVSFLAVSFLVVSFE